MISQRKQALFFFFGTLLLSAGILVWHFRLNRGTLAVSGETPFTVTIGKYKDFLCVESPCSFSIPPKRYFLHASKEAYFDESLQVEVKRFRSQEVKIPFRFRPKIETLGEASLPQKLAGIPAFSGSSFARYDELDLAKIPRGAREIIFAPSGRAALVALGKEFYFYDQPIGAATAALEKIEIPAYEAAVVNHDGGKIFLIEKGQKEKQRLLEVQPHGEKILLTHGEFERPISRASLYLSPDDKQLLVQEKTSLGDSKFYLVDLVKKTRRRFPLPSGAINLRFAHDDAIVYEIKENGQTKVVLVSIADGKETVLDALKAVAVAARDSHHLIAVSDYDPTGKIAATSISEAVQMLREGSEGFSQTPSDTWFFFDLNLGTGEKKLLAAFQHDAGEIFEEMAETVDDRGLFFATKKDDERIHHKLVLSKL